LQELSDLIDSILSYIIGDADTPASENEIFHGPNKTTRKLKLKMQMPLECQVLKPYIHSLVQIDLSPLECDI
jgi:hypothetical protein